MPDLASQPILYLFSSVGVGCGGSLLLCDTSLLSGITAIALPEPCLQTEGEGEIPRWADAGTPPRLAK